MLPKTKRTAEDGVLHRCDQGDSLDKHEGVNK